jgi:hypothetical protein
MSLIMVEQETPRSLEELEPKDFDQIFRIALLLTGSLEAAEKSMIEAMEGEEHKETLLFATIEAAVSHVRSSARLGCRPIPRVALSIDPITLPLELRRVLVLSPNQRLSFVLRRLVGLPAHRCSHLIQISEADVDANVVAAAVSLARIRKNENEAFGRDASGMEELLSA